MPVQEKGVKTYIGYTSIDQDISYDTLTADPQGPIFFGQVSSVSSGNTAIAGFYANRANRSGKRYIEFQIFHNPHIDGTFEVLFGVISAQHDRSLLPGDTSESWVIRSGPGTDGFKTGGVLTTAPTQFQVFSSPGAIRSQNGLFWGGQTYEMIGTVGLAIDFNQGRMWARQTVIEFGNVKDQWDGDPVAGTDPTFTFTANQPLLPIIFLKREGASSQTTIGVCFGAHRGLMMLGPPTGYTSWDVETTYQTEVLADTPTGWWLAAQYYDDYSATMWPGFRPIFQDHSGTGHLFFDNVGVEVVNYFADPVAGVTLPEYKPFPSQRAVMWKPRGLQIAPICDLDEWGDPFSITDVITVAEPIAFEVTARMNGAGQARGSSNIWTEGTAIFHNIRAPQLPGRIAGTVLWLGASLRGRRLFFHISGFELEYATDLADGLYHWVFAYDPATTSMSIYSNGVQVVTRSDLSGISDVIGSDDRRWINIGIFAADLPQDDDVAFPGYFRDIVFYRTALSSARVSAHYAALQEHIAIPSRSLTGATVDPHNAHQPYTLTR